MSDKPYADINAIREIQEVLRQKPSLGHVTFTLKGSSAGGISLNSETGSLIQDGEPDESRIGRFNLTSDEPVALLGSDSGVSPAEYALQALAGCYAVTLSSVAAQQSISLDSLELFLNFDINLNGFLGLDKNERNGAKSIRIDIKLTSHTASRDQLQYLIDMLPYKSPLHDTFANPVNVIPRLIL